jgi:hypothetical protein
MANRYAVATGNWSNTATWDGGTLPGAGDVVRPNGFTVTIDQNITVQELTDNALSPAAQGGTFTVAASGLNINCNILKISNAASALLTIQAAANNTTIVGNIQNLIGSFNTQALLINSTGTTDITGNVFLSATGNFAFAISANAASGTVNYTGTVDMSAATSGTGTAFLLNNNMTINFIGIVNGSSAINTSSTFTNRSASGVLTGNISAVGALSVAVGNDIPTNQNIVINSAIFADGISPIRGAVRFSTVAPTVTVILSDLTNLTLTDPTVSNPPIEADVRSGVIYSGGAFEGTLVVPTPSNVRLGIPTDNTVGTGIITGTDFFNLIATDSDPVAVRLRNVATVQTVGDQFNSF